MECGFIASAVKIEIGLSIVLEKVDQSCNQVFVDASTTNDIEIVHYY
jgi:hypothetical protein